MSIEHSASQPPNVEYELSLREQLLVKSASVIDEQASQHNTQRLKHGQLRWANWSNQAGMSFRLEEQVQQIDPEHIDTTYRCISYVDTVVGPISEFTYYESDPKIKLQHRYQKSRRAKESEIDMLLDWLDQAPTSLSSEKNNQFVQIMQHNEIRQQRRVERLRQTLAKVVFGRHKD